MYKEVEHHDEQEHRQGFIMTFEDCDEPTAIERTLEAFLEEARRRRLIVQDLEIHVDGHHQPLDKTTAEHYMRRIAEASGR